MKTIPLNRGLAALIDDGDYELVSQFRWHANPRHAPGALVQVFYARTREGRLMHRMIMAALPGQPVDHADGDGLNNQRHNLRLCTTSQNNYNGRKRHDGKASRFKGVQKKNGRWRAYIYRAGRTAHLGMFDTEEEAARAYDRMAVQLAGPFARPNFPSPAQDEGKPTT